MENYFTVADVAAKLNLSKPFIREQFRERPGVLRIGSQGRRAKRDYLTLRIPESAVEAFIREAAVPESRGAQRQHQAAFGAHG